MSHPEQDSDDERMDDGSASYDAGDDDSSWGQKQTAHNLNNTGWQQADDEPVNKNSILFKQQALQML